MLLLLSWETATLNCVTAILIKLIFFSCEPLGVQSSDVSRQPVAYEYLKFPLCFAGA